MATLGPFCGVVQSWMRFFANLTTMPSYTSLFCDYRPYFWEVFAVQPAVSHPWDQALCYFSLDNTPQDRGDGLVSELKVESTSALLASSRHIRLAPHDSFSPFGARSDRDAGRRGPLLEALLLVRLLSRSRLHQHRRH